jgi:predicted enzyme related to lactoylglutathione lyase
MAPAEPSGGTGWAVDSWVPDVDAAAARAAELGGRVLVAVHDRPPFRSAVIADPEGAAFSISQPTA